MFGYPLTVSESVCEVIEYINNENEDSISISYNDNDNDNGNDNEKDNLNDNYIVNCSTNNLTINKIENIINSVLKNKLEISLLKSPDFGKFDTPIEIKSSKITPIAPPFTWDFSPLQQQKFHQTIWFTPQVHPHRLFLPKVASNCLWHLRRVIKLTPGISVQQLKNKYENILRGVEVEALVNVLVESGKVQLLYRRFLQLS